MPEQLREVKVVIFLDKARSPFVGMVDWLESLRDLRLKEKVEIWLRSASRLVGLESMDVRSREVRFWNLWNKRGRRKGRRVE
jgi:hypothetical protein